MLLLRMFKKLSKAKSKTKKNTFSYFATNHKAIERSKNLDSKVYPILSSFFYHFFWLRSKGRNLSLRDHSPLIIKEWRSFLFFCRFINSAEQTQNICITFTQRWPNVFDVGPTLYKCHTIVLCLLGVQRLLSFLWQLSSCLLQNQTWDPSHKAS